jgi:hypothetical protein
MSGHITRTIEHAEQFLKKCPQANGPAMAGSPRSRPVGLVRTVVQAAARPTRRNLLHWALWIVALSIELTFLILLRHEEIYRWELEVTRRLQSVPAKQYVFDVTSTLTNTLSIPFLLLFFVITAAVAFPCTCLRSFRKH